MDEGLARFLAALDRLTDDQMSGATDAAGWTVRDHLTHLAAWADGIAALVRREDRWKAMGLAMDNPEAYEDDFDTINAQIAAQHRELSPAEARAWVIAAHRRVAAAVEALDDDDLSAPYDRFVAPFTGDTGHAIVAYVAGNTYEHYAEHHPWIEAIASTL
jgi:uncharacterized protein (TIGR03083 family)